MILSNKQLLINVFLFYIYIGFDLIFFYFSIYILYRLEVCAYLSSKIGTDDINDIIINNVKVTEQSVLIKNCIDLHCEIIK